jgi:hypothetical protein
MLEAIVFLPPDELKRDFMGIEKVDSESRTETPSRMEKIWTSFIKVIQSQ